MTDTYPIPRPPGTPTPPPNESSAEMNAVNVDGPADMLSPTSSTFENKALSPLRENFAFTSRRGSGASAGFSPMQPLSAASVNSLYSSTSTDTSLPLTSKSLQDGKSPFNFTPMTIAKSPVSKSSVGQRRGHKYKHSSVSHQIFLEPAPRAPISLPNSLPVPTLYECRKSMSREQRTRFWWCICHMMVAGYTLWSASGSLALTALSHLIMFDSLGAMLCVVVDVLGNFEVWKRSSIRHPFGIERAEVLAGFASSVLLLFMGLDLISHNLQHLLEGMDGHEPHHTHLHERVSPGSIDFASLLAIIATCVSAFGLRNHARIGKVMRFAYIDSLPSILSNPSHFLTITCSSLLLLLPLMSVEMYTWLDRGLSMTIALSMIVLGSRLVHTLGLMLLMSYTGKGVEDVLRDIESDPTVAAIEEAKFWQVHYGLCMGNLKLRVRGTEENILRLREKVTSLVRNKLGGGYGGGSQKWEVSLQFAANKY
ncbi:Endoplasmic reticulum zinc transporter [Agyrium rufum]|nr:Endoplasmic reticulum zinc transporter [Agyrium rufum]